MKDTGNGVTVTLEGGTTFDAELLLVAVGRGPVSAGLGYEEQGVRVERGFVIVDGYCQTSVPTISAVGDLIPGLQLAHVGFAEGILVAERLAGITVTPIDYDGVPRITYSDPEVASVGITSAIAAERGIETMSSPTILRATARARSCRRRGRQGHRNRRRRASARHPPRRRPGRRHDRRGPAHLQLGGPAVEVAQLIHPHPTQSEAIGEAFLALAGKPLHVHG